MPVLLLAGVTVLPFCSPKFTHPVHVELYTWPASPHPFSSCLVITQLPQLAYMIWIRTEKWGQLKYQGWGMSLPRSGVFRPTVLRTASTILFEIIEGEEWRFAQPAPQIHMFNISCVGGNNTSYFGFFCRDRGDWRQADGLHRRPPVSNHDCWKLYFWRPDSCPHCHLQALLVRTASGQSDHAPRMPVHLLYICKFSLMLVP